MQSEHFVQVGKTKWCVIEDKTTLISLVGTGLKHGMDQETDRKMDQLNLTFVALQVVGRAFTIMV